MCLDLLFALLPYSGSNIETIVKYKFVNRIHRRIVIFSSISRSLQHNEIHIISNQSFTTHVQYLYVF